jgi:hypothetical protein
MRMGDRPTLTRVPGCIMSSCRYHFPQTTGLIGFSYNGMGVLPTAKTDLVCGDSLLYRGTLAAAHRIFASGNERAAVRLNTRYRYGMQIDYDDQFHMLYDLMNESNQPQTYYVEVVRTSRKSQTDLSRPMNGCRPAAPGTSPREWSGWTSSAAATATFPQRRASTS